MKQKLKAVKPLSERGATLSRLRTYSFSLQETTLWEQTWNGKSNVTHEP